MYEDEFKEYHYGRSQTPKDDYAPVKESAAERFTQSERAPIERGPAPKQGFGAKAVALVLACAVVAAGSGFGGAALYGNLHPATVKVVEQQITTPSTEDDGSKTDAAVTVRRTDGAAMTAAEVYEKNVNSVVYIESTTTGYSYFGQQSTGKSAGSGFLITADGYIVTNEHVVSGASKVTVTLYDGTTYDATVVGGDADYDVAVLKIEAADLPAVTLGSSATLKVGDSVEAIGNPLGQLTFSMSQGIVSACNRTITLDETPFNLIQMDTSINPGNSGGPLLNMYGQVVGIVNAKYMQYAGTDVEGVSFAIPIDDVTSVITEIMASGSVIDKAYMAITCGTMTSQMAQQYDIDIDKGVFVYSVVSGGAGEKAGLQMGDVITKLNDTVLTSRTDMTAAMKNFRAGDTVTLTVYRGGSYQTLELTFDARPQTTGTQSDSQSQDPYGGYGQNPYGDSQNPYGDYDMDDLFRYFFGNRG